MADDPVRWLRRGVVIAIIVLGWVFIAWQNKFHVTAPVAFVCLGFLAVVLTVYNLWRTGAAAVSPDLGDEEAWARPLGARGELEKEKRTLLKAIKEAEFDHEMGKLSKADADAMISTYRARAIAVIKELERFDDTSHPMDPSGRILDKHDTVRDQIAREVKARLELAGANRKKKAKAGAKAAGAKVETTADKVETAADKVETAADKVETAADKVAAAADEVATTGETVHAANDEPAPAGAVEAAAATDDSSGATEATS